MSGEFKYKAFISYSHADVKWAKWLHRTLETYRTPKRLLSLKTEQGEAIPTRLSPIFRDREELSSSHDLSESIRVALEQSENLIVICSPKAAASKWVNQEIESFKKQGRQQHIYYLIVAGDPVATGAEQACFPPAVHQSYDVAGNATDKFIDPIAADVRQSGDGKALARMKIIAGMLGVGLDELRQREQQRKNRRLVIVSASSIFASIVTVGLAINATLARDEAERRQQQAEELLGFMVGDLRSSLEPIGRLDLLESVGQQAMTYFATVDVNDLSDEELLRQSQVMTQLGEIRFSQLDYKEALTYFVEAYDRSYEMYLNNPSDGEALFNKAQAEFWVGFVHWRSGNLEEAKSWMTKYRDSSLELYALDRTRDDWLSEVAFGQHNLSVIAQDLGDLESAVSGFEMELEILDQLIERNANQQTIQARADVYSWLGDIAIQQGDMEKALENYQEQVAIFRAQIAIEPENNFWVEKLAFATQLMAEVTSLMGKLEESISFSETSSELFESLLAIDDSKISLYKASARPLITLGKVSAALDNWNEAAIYIRAALEIMRNVINGGNSDHNVLAQIAEAHLIDARIEENSGDIAAAILSVGSALNDLNEIRKADRLNEERLGLMATAYIMKIELVQLADNSDSIAEDLGLLDEILNSSSESPYILDPKSRYFSLIGKDKEAKEISDALAMRHYFPLNRWND